MVQSASPIWVTLGDDGYEITNVGYSTRISVDLFTLEILAIAAPGPCSLSQIVAWMTSASPSRVQRRVDTLLSDGFLVPAGGIDNVQENWWRRWGLEARRLHEACRRVRFLSGDDEVTGYKQELQKDGIPTRDTSTFRARSEQQSAAPLERLVDYWSVINGRRTATQHAGQVLRSAELERLISLTFAVQEVVETVGLGVAVRKRYANAGGRHELEIFSVDFSRDGPNICRYDDMADTFKQYSSRLTREDLNAVTGHQGLADHASGAIVITSDLERASWKYRGPSGYRTSLINVGFAGQLLLQNSTAMQMTARITDSIDQEGLQTLFGLPAELLPYIVVTVSGPECSAR